MPVVFSTHAEVAHSWAQQNQLFGRSPTPSGGGRFGFSGGANSADCPRVRYLGRMFYSYRTPVARLEDTPDGLALLTVPNEWGPATRGHIADAVKAVSHLIGANSYGNGGRQFEVPCIGNPQGPRSDRIDGVDASNAAEWATPSAIDHLGNYQHLAEAYLSAAKGYRSQRAEPCAWHENPFQAMADNLAALWTAARDYAAYFGPVLPVEGLPASLEGVRADAEAIAQDRAERAARALARLTPAEKERREKAKREREAKRTRLEALRFADASERLEGWREGLNVPTHRLPRADYAYLRATGVKRKGNQITGGTLETSWGARVPLREAVRVFQFLKCVRESGQGWRPAGLRGIRVGQFAVNSIDPTGGFVAGCHSFAWPEIERLAASLGVADLPCNRIAEDEA